MMLVSQFEFATQAPKVSMPITELVITSVDGEGIKFRFVTSVMFRWARQVTDSNVLVVSIMLDASRFTKPVALGDMLAWRKTSVSFGPGPKPVSGDVSFESALVSANVARRGRRYVGFILGGEFKTPLLQNLDVLLA
jgi:hypothetical protein